MKKVIKNIGFVILAEVAVLVLALVFLSYMGGLEPREMFYCLSDLPTLAGLLIIIVPSVFLFGLHKDFGRAFMAGSKNYSLMQLKNSVEAVKTVQKIILSAGAVVTIIGLIDMMRNLTTAEMVGPNLAVVCITIFYTAVLELLILPVRFNIVKIMNTAMDMDEE